MLEGYLFGIHLAPYEIESEEWGEELESLLPETCEVTDQLINDCQCLYNDMLEGIIESQFFRIHTVKFVDHSDKDELSDSPAYYWISGLHLALDFVFTELEILSKQKRFKKNKDFRKFVDNYKEYISQLPLFFLLILKSYSKEIDLFAKLSEQVEVEKPLTAQDLSEKFESMLDALTRLNDTAIEIFAQFVESA